MRPRPRCAVARDREVRSFAETDPRPRRGGEFFDPGQGVAVRGASAEPRWRREDGSPQRTGRELRCPARAVGAVRRAGGATGSFSPDDD